MKVLLHKDKSVEFLDRSGTINQNDVMRQVIEVEVEEALGARESLWITYQREKLVYTNTIYLREESGLYTALIPKEVLLIAGEWSFQLFVRLYDTVNEQKYMVQLASDKATFTVQEGLTTEDGLPVTDETAINIQRTIVDDLAAANQAKEAAKEYAQEAAGSANQAAYQANVAQAQAGRAEGLANQVAENLQATIEARNEAQQAEAKAKDSEVNSKASETNAKSSAREAYESEQKSKIQAGYAELSAKSRGESGGGTGQGI